MRVPPSPISLSMFKDLGAAPMTLNAAEMWGVADKLGSLDVGKTANVVVSTGDPLDVTSDVKQVYIEGKAVSMSNRQTLLRDRYSSR